MLVAANPKEEGASSGMNHVDLKPYWACIICITSLSGLCSSMYKCFMVGLYAAHGSWGTSVGAVQLGKKWLIGSEVPSTSEDEVPIEAASAAFIPMREHVDCWTRLTKLDTLGYDS